MALRNRKRCATVRLDGWQQPVYVRIGRLVGPQYAHVVVTAPTGRPGWRQGSDHLVPVARLCQRPSGRHARRWWQR